MITTDDCRVPRSYRKFSLLYVEDTAEDKGCSDMSCAQVVCFRRGRRTLPTHSILPSDWGHHQRSQSHSEQLEAHMATTSGSSTVAKVPQQLVAKDGRNETMLQHRQCLDRCKRKRDHGKPEERKRRVINGCACDDWHVRSAAKAAALATLGWRKVRADYRSDYTHPTCGAVNSIQDILRQHGFKLMCRF